MQHAAARVRQRLYARHRRAKGISPALMIVTMGAMWQWWLNIPRSLYYYCACLCLERTERKREREKERKDWNVSLSSSMALGCFPRS